MSGRHLHCLPTVQRLEGDNCLKEENGQTSCQLFLLAVVVVVVVVVVQQHPMAMQTSKQRYEELEK